MLVILAITAAAIPFMPEQYIQRFQSIGGRYPQVVQRPRIVEHAQFASRNMLDFLWQTLRTNSIPDFLCFSGTKILDHETRITLCVI